MKHVCRDKANQPKNHNKLLIRASSQLIQELINGESEFVKEVEFFTSHHLKHADSSDAPPDVTSQKEAIFRNIDDIKSFHNKWAHLLNVIFSHFSV